nr:retrovirus-related Pol polyprotein from transposon TNT 1-94 [Tanacetum cinerariifolium]
MSSLPHAHTYHFIRDHILKGDIELHFIPTEYQLADIFTKPLDEPTFSSLKAELGMLNIDWDSVSPPPLVAKPKKGKPQTVAPTLPKSQGLEALGALSKKRTKPKSKRPSTETKESPPKPTEGLSNPT